MHDFATQLNTCIISLFVTWNFKIILDKLYYNFHVFGILKVTLSYLYNVIGSTIRTRVFIKFVRVIGILCIIIFGTLGVYVRVMGLIVLPHALGAGYCLLCCSFSND